MQHKIFPVDGRLDFAAAIASKTSTTEVGSMHVGSFSDGTFTVQLGESVRGKKVFLVCSTGNSDNIVKLLLAINAAKMASASEVVAVIPYFGYSRQDKIEGERGCTGAKVMASALESAGAGRVITVDLHSEQIRGFFNVPVDPIKPRNDIAQFLFPMLDENTVLASPDAGGAHRVDSVLKMVRVSNDYPGFVMLSKRRPRPNEVSSMELIGSVKGKKVIIIDDIADTAGTLCKAADVLMEEGATHVEAVCTHGVLSGNALKNIEKSSLKRLTVFDTLEVKPQGKINVIGCSDLIAVAVEAIAIGTSAADIDFHRYT